MTVEKRQSRAKKIAEDKAKREAAIKAGHEAGAAHAQSMLDAGELATKNHGYLKTKRVEPCDGVKVGTWVKEWTDANTGEVHRLKIPDSLLVPMFVFDAEAPGGKRLVGAQGIFPDSKTLGRDKDFITGGQKQGAWFKIGKAGDEIEGLRTIAITEGYSTGASIYEATGICTIVAFDAGNLVHVAKAWRTMRPDWRIVVAGDDDRYTAVNTGKKGAREALDAIGLPAVGILPRFQNLDGNPKDFNDMVNREGAPAVKARIMAAIRGERDPGEPIPEPGSPEEVAEKIDAAFDTERAKREAEPSARRARPELRITPGEMPRVVDEAEAALIANCHDIFQRGSLIVRPAITKIRIADGKTIQGQRLIKVKRHHLAERMTEAAQWKKWNARRDEWVDDDCPPKYAETYLDREGLWKLPALTGIINAPTLRADGSILETPGFDDATGLLFDPQGATFEPIPENPSQADAIDALKLLKEPISKFPFVGGADLSVALSGILIPACADCDS